MNKKVSIIIPCYNQEKYVIEAIQSALMQTYSNIEIVCINDGSTDGSASTIETFVKNHKNIIFINKKENKGVIQARNEAIISSSGEYILPLDADDTIEPTYIEKAVKILENNSNIGIVYCKARIFGNENKYWKLEEFNKSNILYSNCIFCSALFRKSDFMKIGKYKDYMKDGCEDYDLWLSFIEHGFGAHRIDEILFNYRKYEDNSRTKECARSKNRVWTALIKNHINLYLKDEQFYERLFLSNPIKIKNKYTKYKKLFNIVLLVAVIESIILIVMVYMFILKG